MERWYFHIFGYRLTWNIFSQFHWYLNCHLQGLFIFIFHCLMNEKVFSTLQRYIIRSSWCPQWCKDCVGTPKQKSSSKENSSHVRFLFDQCFIGSSVQSHFSYYFDSLVMEASYGICWNSAGCHTIRQALRNPPSRNSFQPIVITLAANRHQLKVTNFINDHLLRKPSVQIVQQLLKKNRCSGNQVDWDQWVRQFKRRWIVIRINMVLLIHHFLRIEISPVWTAYSFVLTHFLLLCWLYLYRLFNFWR